MTVRSLAQDAGEILEKIRRLHAQALVAAEAAQNPERSAALRLFAANLHKASSHSSPTSSSTTCCVSWTMRSVSSKAHFNCGRRWWRSVTSKKSGRGCRRCASTTKERMNGALVLWWRRRCGLNWQFHRRLGGTYRRRPGCSKSMLSSSRKSREEAPTLNVRWLTAVTHRPSAVDQYCSWRCGTCSLTIFVRPARR